MAKSCSHNIRSPEWARSPGAPWFERRRWKLARPVQNEWVSLRYPDPGQIIAADPENAEKLVWPFGVN